MAAQGLDGGADADLLQRRGGGVDAQPAAALARGQPVHDMVHVAQLSEQVRAHPAAGIGGARQAPSTAVRTRPAVSSPRARLAGPSCHATGKNGVPAGMVAAAAKRKLPDPPGVVRPSDAMTSAADRVADRWTPPDTLAMATLVNVADVEVTMSTSQGASERSSLSATFAGPTLRRRRGPRRADRAPEGRRAPRRVRRARPRPAPAAWRSELSGRRSLRRRAPPGRR